MGMKRRCQKGKTCGATCISNRKTCLVDLKQTLSNSVGKVGEMVQGGQEEERPTRIVPAPSTETTPTKSKKKEEEEEEEEEEKMEDAFKGERGKKFIQTLVEGLDELKSEMGSDEVVNLARSHFRESREFVRNLQERLPPGVKAKMDEKTNMVTMTMKTKSGDDVKVVFSTKMGFHFTVNGTHDAGTVKTERGQLQVALAVRSMFNATLASLPPGQVIRTMAHADDGKGQKREEIYKKLKFSPPDDIGQMWGKVSPNGTLTPSDRNSWADTARESKSAFFAEMPKVAEIGSVKDWYQIVFGTPLKVKKVL